MEPLRVGDLKKVLEDLPDDLPVGVEGWFGEFYSMTYKPSVRVYPIIDNPSVRVYPIIGHSGPPKRKEWKALVFDHVDIGPEPDYPTS